jgi:cytochrome c-type biogenesis protein CcmH/NrfF
MTSRRWLAVSWGVLGLVVAFALVIGSVGQPPPTPAERVRSLSGQFACPQCAGQSVLHSDVGISVEIRAEITRRVEQGQNDDQILSALVGAYGREYLLTPSASGAASLAWIIPVFAGVVALAGLVVAFWRWRPSPTEVTDDERALVEQARHREGSGG